MENNLKLLFGIYMYYRSLYVIGNTNVIFNMFSHS